MTARPDSCDPQLIEALLSGAIDDTGEQPGHQKQKGHRGAVLRDLPQTPVEGQQSRGHAKGDDVRQRVVDLAEGRRWRDGIQNS